MNKPKKITDTIHIKKSNKKKKPFNEFKEGVRPTKQYPTINPQDGYGEFGFPK